jgi:acyl carrier protein
MTKQPFTLHDLQEILTEHVGLTPDELPDDSRTPFTYFGLDSLAIVAIQHGLEQRCGIEVPDGDAHHMTSQASVIEYINARLTLPAA